MMTRRNDYNDGKSTKIIHISADVDLDDDDYKDKGDLMIGNDDVYHHDDEAGRSRVTASCHDHTLCSVN